MSESDSDQDHQPDAAPEAELEREKSEFGRDALYRAVIGGTVAAKPTGLELHIELHIKLYIERFRRFDEAGGMRLGWHWPAFFVTFLWLVYRRMYLVAALYFVLPFFLRASTEGPVSEPTPPPESLAQLFSEMSIQDIVLSFGPPILFFIVPAIFADSVYWWHANRMIRDAEQKFADPPDQIAWLRKRGGTSSIWLVLLAFVVFLLSVFWIDILLLI